MESKEKPVPQERPILGCSRNGIQIRDRAWSHLHTEDGLTPETIAEALARIDITHEPGERAVFTVQFDRVIGLCSCVAVEENDPRVFYVRRKNRSWVTPVLRDADPVPTDKLTLAIRRIDEDVAELITAYPGEQAPYEPGDKFITDDAQRELSERFWRTHALIYREEEPT